MEEEKPIVKGEQNPEPTAKQKEGFLTKEDLMFRVDEDGKVMPEKVTVEVYDKALDDEILLTTLELDTALSMHDSTKKAFKQLIQNLNPELKKLNQRISDLEALEKRTKDQAKVLIDSRKDLIEREKSLRELDMQNAIKLQAYQDKINESRKDLTELESIREKEKKIKYIDAIPCIVAEAHKYFTKRMWKNEKEEWQSPLDDEDTTYISHLLSEKVSNPELTVDEWDKVKPSMRLSIKDAIAGISFYDRPSPKEILVNRRRSEKLKNIKGDCQD